jgi:hypothetical protein
VRKLTEVNLIHKSDVYFDVVEPTLDEHILISEPRKNMHHGEIYIYQNQIYLYDGRHWYKANISDIKDIKSLANHKQILIKFWNFDLVLTCNEYPHLLALRDFLFLAQKNYIDNNFLIPGTEHSGGGGL